jgi:hypothetical protein
VKRSGVLVLWLLPLGALAQDCSESSLLKSIEQTRSRIKGARAMYKLEIRVKKASKAEDPTKLSRGLSDEDLEIGAAIDANASCQQEPEIPPKKGQPHLGAEIYYSMPDSNYAVLDGGMRGGFGPWTIQRENPLAIGFELGGSPPTKDLKGWTVSRETTDNLEASQDTRRVEISTIRRGENVYLEQVTYYFEGNKISSYRILEWKEVNAEYYPSHIMVELGGPNQKHWQTREYRLLKFYGVPKERIAPKYLEGATVKDHEKNLVYTVKNGKFVLDPRFSKNVASDTTWRRIGFVGSVLLVGGGATWWLVKRRRNAATAKLSS